MDEQQLSTLLNKVLAGTATDEEKSLVEKWYQQESAKEVTWETSSPNEEAELEHAMLNRLQEHIRSQRPGIFYMRPLLRVAAVIAFFICLGGSVLYLNKPQHTVAIETVAGTTQNRYILLPDSSVVLLHPGSKIEYNFTSKVRSLTLEGEAFFDIKHRADQPFVIHTGTVTTTVLGTAFNIKAYRGQKVVVTVTRGKVSVSDGAKQVRAVLTPNQAAEVNEKTRSVAQKQVSDQTAISWVKADMQFDEITFKELTDRLAKRYDVTFVFKNPLLEKSLITGRFRGTESLQEVLDVITITTSTSYSADGNVINIDGKGHSE